MHNNHSPCQDEDPPCFAAVSVLGTLFFHALAFALLHFLSDLSPPSSTDTLLTTIPDSLSRSLLDDSMARQKEREEEIQRRRDLARKPFVRTTAEQESASTPLEPQFVSDHNTTARSLEAPGSEAAPPGPTITNAPELPGASLSDQEHRDGPIENTETETTATAPPPTRNTEPNPATTSQSASPLAEHSDVPSVDGSLPDLPPPIDSYQPEPNLIQSDPPESDSVPEKPVDDVIPPEDDPFLQASRLIEMPPTTLQKKSPTKNTYQPETRRGKTQGNTDVGGDESYNAENTPVGQYLKEIDQRIGREWYRVMRNHLDVVRSGSLRVRFRVNESGHPMQMEVLKNQTNAATANATLKSILSAKIPPMPKPVAELADKEGIEIIKNFYIY